jgi:hypothetical protein
VRDSLISWQQDGRVCVAEFFPPRALALLEEWKVEFRDDFGPPEQWLVKVGRAVSGGDWASVWVLRQHLPPGFPVSDKHLDS